MSPYFESNCSRGGTPVSNVKLLCILGSKNGLEHVQAEFPELEVMNSALLFDTLQFTDQLQDLGFWCGSQLDVERAHLTWSWRYCRCSDVYEDS